MADNPTEFDLFGGLFTVKEVDPAPGTPETPDSPEAEAEAETPDSPETEAPTPRTLDDGEVFTERLQDYASNEEHLARLDSQPFRDFLASIDLSADEAEELSPDDLLALITANGSASDPSLGLLDGGGYAGDLLIIESNYRQALSLLETTTFFFLSIIMTMVVILMGIFVVIGLDWPVAVSIILVAMLFLYFASVAYRSVVSHSLQVARSDQIRAIVRVRRLARMNVARTPTVLAWAQHIGSKP